MFQVRNTCSLGRTRHGFGKGRGWVLVRFVGFVDGPFLGKREQQISQQEERPWKMWMFPKIVGFPPKSCILIGFSIIDHPFWGIYPYFWKQPCHVLPMHQDLGLIFF